MRPEMITAIANTLASGFPQEDCEVCGHGGATRYIPQMGGWVHATRGQCDWHNYFGVR